MKEWSTDIKSPSIIEAAVNNWNNVSAINKAARDKKSLMQQWIDVLCVISSLRVFFYLYHTANCQIYPRLYESIQFESHSNAERITFLRKCTLNQTKEAELLATVARVSIELTKMHNYLVHISFTIQLALLSHGSLFCQLFLFLIPYFTFFSPIILSSTYTWALR